MGFLGNVGDKVSDVFNKGATAAGRAADNANLKLRQSDADQRWRAAVTKLGESLVEEVRATPALRVGREEILAELAAIDEERAEIAAELDRIAAEKAAEKAAKWCSSCGAALVKGAKFCVNCGAPVPGAAGAELLESSADEPLEIPESDVVVEASVVEVVPDYPAPEYPGPADVAAAESAAVPEYAAEDGYPAPDVPLATDATVDYPAMEYPGPGVADAD